MKRFLQRLGRPQRSPYDLRKVVSRQIHREYAQAPGRLHIVCDIDKTYLETRFESVLNLVKIPFESPADKVTVEGASEFLMALRWGRSRENATDFAEFPRGLHFVSSSPPQLRGTMQAKLRLDGLDWNSDTFKNQAYNIMRGRMDLLKQHVAYKSAAILGVIRSLPNGTRLIFIGDNAESDPYIYFGIVAALAGRLSPEGYGRYLLQAGVDDDLAKILSVALADLPKAEVAAVLIRRAPGYHATGEPPLNQLIRTFDNYFQAALILNASGLLEDAAVWPITRRFHNNYGLSTDEQSAWLNALRQTRANLSQSVLVAEECLARLTARANSGIPTASIPTLAPIDTTFLNAWREEDVLREASRWLKQRS